MLWFAVELQLHAVYYNDKQVDWVQALNSSLENGSIVKPCTFTTVYSGNEHWLLTKFLLSLQSEMLHKIPLGNSRFAIRYEICY